MRRSRKRKNGLKLIALMVMIICVVVLFKSTQLGKEAIEKERKIASTKTLIEEQEERAEELAERKNFLYTKKYIEEIARSMLGLVYPDEIILKKIEDGVD